jgi:hypothetical protein
MPVCRARGDCPLQTCADATVIDGWTQVSPSEFTWEQEALDYLYNLGLMDHQPRAKEPAQR